ncbi:MAG: hypothetical protein GAK30_02002 [Paracidovorax wautersii]|uniref:Tripartite-type tricarboxylate transporter, receptor component TctC n=1 Tax=Paracidovorax wautersii TaxID=1177982 RepID=A0A7V8FNX2_9BURK|nr:MAG: hypothetical protein GAK30_02002 [Paracidovorax wautersii]
MQATRLSPTASNPARASLSRRRLVAGALGLASLAAGVPALAQDPATWPSRPIRLIVGYPAGSSPDMQARLLAEPLGRALGQPVVVENKPGAGGNIGADQVAKATDQHTVGVIGNGPLTSSKFLYSRLPYDPLKDLAPIALIGTSPLVWVVPAAAMPGDSRQYVAHAQAAGDKLAYGSIGAGSGGHLGMELLKPVLRIKPLHVPYAGGPAIVNDILGGQVDMTLLPTSTVMPLIRSGKLKAVAVTSAKRTSLAPDVPAMPEVGAQGVNIEVWNAIMAPANLPAPYQAKLSQALDTILRGADIRDKLFQQGWAVEDSTPASLARRIQADSKLYGDLIAREGIKLD